MGHINNLFIHMVEKHHGSDGVLRLFTQGPAGNSITQPGGRGTSIPGATGMLSK
jgi:hypothetical protein